MSIDIHTIRDGRIHSTFHLEDWAGALRQLTGQALPLTQTPRYRASSALPAAVSASPPSAGPTRNRN